MEDFVMIIENTELTPKEAAQKILNLDFHQKSEIYRLMIELGRNKIEKITQQEKEKSLSDVEDDDLLEISDSYISTHQEAIKEFINQFDDISGEIESIIVSNFFNDEKSLQYIHEESQIIIQCKRDEKSSGEYFLEIYHKKIGSEPIYFLHYQLFDEEQLILEKDRKGVYIDEYGKANEYEHDVTFEYKAAAILDMSINEPEFRGFQISKKIELILCNTLKKLNYTMFAYLERVDLVLWALYHSYYPESDDQLRKVLESFCAFYRNQIEKDNIFDSKSSFFKSILLKKK